VNKTFKATSDAGRSQSQKGFTIIEVLIVLAIAGLILLIVFLAVPALQRNSRNTQRRTDVTRLLGAVHEVSNNNNTTLPSVDTAVEALTNLGFYQTSGVTLSTCTTLSCPTHTPTVDTVELRMHATCPASVPATGAVTLTYRNRAYAAVFAVESSGSALINQCTQS
jgi:prepilin-type N-terminal cleavage/methylation domain-containing protein